MNKLKFFLLAALALLGTGALAQNPLSEAVASGNKVYWEIEDDLPRFTKLMIDGKASPRTWLTPSILDLNGHVLWEAKTQQADATMFNGYKATNTCIKKVIEKSFQDDLFKKAGRY